jgi:uncharacterized protein (DUF1015 family)
MPEFLPFIGTRYNSAKVPLANVTSPPYDVISDEFRNQLYERDPHNVVRLEFSRESDPYSSAAALLSMWKQQEILRRDAMPAYYVYRQIFDVAGIGEVTRSGVIGRLKVAEYGEHQVIPHERTHAGPKEDRLKLMEATLTNLSPIFGLISEASFVFDETLELATVNPALVDIDEVLPDGKLIRHLLWRLDDQSAAARIAHIVGKSSVIIADGHHRYETALEFHRRHPEFPQAAYQMMFISNLQAPGAVILPTHRLLHDTPNFDQYRLLEQLKERFELLPIASREEGLSLLERDSDAITLLEFPDEPKHVLLRDPKPHERDVTSETLAVSRIEHEILRPLIGLSDEAIAHRTNLLYPHSEEELDEMEESQPWDMAFLVRAVRPDELTSVVEHGGFMPQKTTYFYPKLLTGLVMHEFEAQS